MTEKAKQFAIEAHQGQWYGGKPYEFHLSAVVTLVAQARDPVLHPNFLEDIAWLHDVLEDTEVDAIELVEQFGSFITRSVQIITDPSGQPNRASRKTMTNSRLRICNVEDITERAALIVKIADRLANIKYSALNGDHGKLEMYRKEHAAFEAAVRREDMIPSYWDRMKFELGLIQPNNT
jgi:(p)ppGpp synthase/HD superfamily hydrolase